MEVWQQLKSVIQVLADCLTDLQVTNFNPDTGPGDGPEVVSFRRCRRGSAVRTLGRSQQSNAAFSTTFGNIEEWM